MSRIAKKFDELKRKYDKALITFITAGDPDLAATEDCILEMARCGADIIELGVPFSDPMADGPTIQMSSERALASGTTLPGILAMVKTVRKRCDIPIVLMGYFNQVFRYGIARFAKDAATSGVDGVLIVDLPPEEAVEFKNATSLAGIELISLLTPTSDEKRIRKVLKFGGGFIYYVSVTGVTGERSAIANSLFARVSEIRGLSSLPVAVGFGISDSDQVAMVARVADGVVVGSAIVKLFEKFSGDQLISELGKKIVELKKGTSEHPGNP